MNDDTAGMDLGKWSTQLRKGLIELCIVALLSRGEMYGYDLVKRLASIKSLVISEGTIYPLLSRLRAAGLLMSNLRESSSGPVRKYYALTPEGEQALALMRAHWAELADGVKQLLESENDHA
jgi:PadR family transcriptional regulator PadR